MQLTRTQYPSRERRRSVFAQRFDVSPLVDADGDGLYLALTDGLLLLRFSFGFTGATLITGAVTRQLHPLRRARRSRRICRP